MNSRVYLEEIMCPYLSTNKNKDSCQESVNLRGLSLPYEFQGLFGRNMPLSFHEVHKGQYRDKYKDSVNLRELYLMNSTDHLGEI